MTNSTLEEIEAAAGKATGGDWTIRPKHPQCVIGLLANGVGVIVADTSGDTDMTSEQWAANAAYIALLDPQTVLALISELRAARKALEPFANVGRLIDGPFGPALFHDDEAAFKSGCLWKEDGETKTLSWGDFRRARDAINSKEP